MEELVRAAAQRDDFKAGAASIARWVAAIPADRLVDVLLVAGNIPECFERDGRAEKLCARLMEVAASRTLKAIGFSSRLSGRRGNAPDVVARGGGIRLVADTKTFRMSRTAKNQKDFKVEALHQWKRGADRAILFAPAYQYPQKSSQIYAQAARYDVALFTYWQLAHWVESGVGPGDVAAALAAVHCGPERRCARSYWESAERAAAMGMEEALHAVEARGRAATVAMAAEQERRCDAEEAALAALSHADLLAKCRSAMGFETRRRAITGVLRDISAHS
jgi:type II restriction enzyme